jgi:hypothetical protein
VAWQDIGERMAAAEIARDDGDRARGTRRNVGAADRWIVDDATGRARAQRSGAVLAIGDIVTVQIIAVDLASRHLDLLITKRPQKSALAPEKGERAQHDSRDRGDRRGKPIGARNEKKRGKRSGFKKGRRGRKSR